MDSRLRGNDKIKNGQSQLLESLYIDHNLDSAIKPLNFNYQPRDTKAFNKVVATGSHLPRRSAADTLEACHLALARKGSAQWIFEADNKSCFDKIHMIGYGITS